MFNPSTKIVFTLKYASHINLTVYNLWGQQVSCLAEGYFQPGYYQYLFHANKLASGVYFCRITGEHINSTLKMELLK